MNNQERGFPGVEVPVQSVPPSSSPRGPFEATPGVEPPYTPLPELARQEAREGDFYTPLPTEAFLQATVWEEWAHGELRRRAAELERLQSNNYHQRQQISTLKDQLGSLQRTLEGAEAWIRGRRNSVQTYNIGEQVVVGPPDGPITATVEAVHLDRGGTWYEVSWWNGLQHMTQRIHETHVQPAKDHLTHPYEYWPENPRPVPTVAASYNPNEGTGSPSP